MRLWVAAVIVGLVAALAPAALISYDSATATPKGSSEQVTAASVASTTPSVSTGGGSSGLIDQSGSLAVAAVLVVLAVGVIAGGRVLSTRRDIW